MSFPYQFFIAFRYFRSKKKHRGLSVNTVISIIGVALGVMALIIVLSVMGGFHEDLQKKILGVNAHLVVLNYEGKVGSHTLLREKIDTVPGVRHSSPFIYGQVMLSFRERAHGAVVRGVDPEIEADTTEIFRHIKEGSIDRLKGDAQEIPGIILGRELARNLGIFIGDELKMIIPMGDIGPLGMLPKVKKFKLSGVFEVGMFEYDSNLALVHISEALVHISEAQKFFNLSDEVTGIEVKVDDIYHAKTVAEKIETLLGPPYYARDWMEMNKNLFSALKLEKLVMFVILTLIVLVASFNIISNLIMIVCQFS
jgi:lipoprotein-releasing system permease protein